MPRGCTNNRIEAVENATELFNAEFEKLILMLRDYPQPRKKSRHTLPTKLKEATLSDWKDAEKAKAFLDVVAYLDKWTEELNKPSQPLRTLSKEPSKP